MVGGLCQEEEHHEQLNGEVDYKARVHEEALHEGARVACGQVAYGRVA